MSGLSFLLNLLNKQSERADVFERFCLGNNVTVLGINIKQISLMRVVMSVAYAFAHTNRSKAILDCVDSSRADAARGGATRDHQRINAGSGQRRAQRGAEEGDEKTDCEGVHVVFLFFLISLWKM